MPTILQAQLCKYTCTQSFFSWKTNKAMEMIVKVSESKLSSRTFKTQKQV